MDDHEPFRQLLCELLRGAGYEVAAAGACDEALALAYAVEPIDLLLTDVRIRRESGARLAGEILTSRPGLRVVYMSGDEREITLVHADQPFLPKPFSAEELLSIVAEVLAVGPGDPFER